MGSECEFKSTIQPVLYELQFRFTCGFRLLLIFRLILWLSSQGQGSKMIIDFFDSMCYLPLLGTNLASFPMYLRRPPASGFVV